jgi:ureidoglycolate lyase
MSTTTVHTIVAEVATPESFAPYGQLLSHHGDPLPHVYGDDLTTMKVGTFESDAPVQFISTRSKLRELRVQFLERHHQITQTFIPIGGDPIMLAVAAPDAPLENSMPTLDSMRAFVIPGSAAANIHRGTWHEVPFPLIDDSLTLLTSHAGVTDGWAELDEHTREIIKGDEEKRDVTDRSGARVIVELPADAHTLR